MHTRLLRSPRRTPLAAGAALAASLAILAACGSNGDFQLTPDRPTVTFTASDDRLQVPSEVAEGFVDVHLTTEPGGGGHHLVIARLNDGVTLDQALSSGDEAFFTMMTIKGGNGTIAGGEDVTMTLDLERGNYFALDNPQNPKPNVAPFTVVASERRSERPGAEGTVRMGPGMVVAVPGDFDGTGTWRFVNDDPAEVHEAALVKLAAGKTAADIVDWGHAGFAGPPPIDGEFGSMGALGPGEEAWIEIEPGEPGEYALVCFVPGRDGIPHLAKGMVTPVTIGE